MKWTDEQLDAINKNNTSIIVSAGAGSGKTAVLTERVIRKIKSGVNINELLILTFTNKAANEMLERIRKSLKKYPEFSEQLNLINSAYITTFDSFALSILKKYHYILKVPKNIQIADDSIIYLKKVSILDNIFENLYKNEDPLFLELINNFCTKDDSDIKSCLLSIYNDICLIIDKNDYMEHYIEKYFSDKQINLGIHKYEELINSEKEVINSYLEEISDIDIEYYDKLFQCLQKLLETYTYDDIKENLQFRLPNLPKDASDELKNVKDKLSKAIVKIKELCFYDSTEEIISSYISTKSYTQIIISILKSLDEQLMAYKLENNIYEFNDISIMLIDLLKNNDQICNELKKQFKEIMIDEYQDNNDIQEELISLIANNNVYMVGDIKQSIYRFRNANPYIFKTKYEKYSKGIEGISINLNRNFRSRNEVLDNINLIFSKLMSSQFGGADFTNGHEMVYGNKSFDNLVGNQNYNMDILNYNYDKKYGFTKEEIEIFIMANDILNKIENKYQVVDKVTNKLRDCTFSDFAILVDRSSNFNLVKKIFEFKKIPLTIYKDEYLTNDSEIIVIKNIIALVLKIKENNFTNEFKYLFISIARSFVFEYSDNDIFKMFNDNNFTNNDIYLKCYKLSKYIDTYTNVMFLDKIIDEFSITENVIKLGDIQNRLVRLDYLNNLAANLDSLGYTINNFSDYLDKLKNYNHDIRFSLSKDNPNNVQIMTIHSSKGLEFNICYFPLLYKEFNLRELNEKFLFDKEYGIITPYFKEGIGKTIFKSLLKKKYIQEEISEKIRLFYVALTRAKENMVIIMPKNVQNNDEINIKDKQDFKTFLDMINFLGSITNPYKIDIDIQKIGLSHDYNFQKKSKDLKQIEISQNKFEINELHFEEKFKEKDNFSKVINSFISKEDKKNLEIGTYLHYLLEHIDFKNNDIDDYPIDSFYKHKINNFLKLPIFKNINNSDIYKEYEFIEVKDGIKRHGIIDLMLVYDEHIDIIDYKFRNIDDENYEKQLKGYKDYIEEKMHKKTNIYLYSIMEEKLKSIEQ